MKQLVVIILIACSVSLASQALAEQYSAPRPDSTLLLPSLRSLSQQEINQIRNLNESQLNVFRIMIANCFVRGYAWGAEITKAGYALTPYQIEGGVVECINRQFREGGVR